MRVKTHGKNRQMMKQLALALLALSVLSACAGKQSTGTSTAPAKAYVKVGKPYTIKGVTYTPSHQPSYKEEGLASWYGPGFHGQSTANGETFDKWDLTAAHPTLPMPSLVRVTHLKTGKQVVVRINDRGPFAKGRIIDLSRRAAEELGTIGEGVARVRVEYMPEESAKLMQLVEGGKRPFDVDIENEVLKPVQLARGGTTDYASTNREHDRRSIWEKMSVVSSAQASEPPKPSGVVAPSEASPRVVQSSELPPLSAPAGGNTAVSSNAAPTNTGSIYDVLPDDSAPPQPTPATPKPAIANNTGRDDPAPAPVAANTTGYYVRLASFSSKERAESLIKTFAPNDLIIEPMDVGGRTLYRTRVGPLYTKSEADRMITKAFGVGLKDAYIVRIAE